MCWDVWPSKGDEKKLLIVIAANWYFSDFVIFLFSNVETELPFFIFFNNSHFLCFLWNSFIYIFILGCTKLGPEVESCKLLGHTIELHIYIEEVERTGLGRGTGLQLPAEGFSYKLLFFL
jgi:hypothetical protein